MVAWSSTVLVEMVITGLDGVLASATWASGRNAAASRASIPSTEMAMVLRVDDVAVITAPLPVRTCHVWVEIARVEGRGPVAVPGGRGQSPAATGPTHRGGMLWALSEIGQPGLLPWLGSKGPAR